eukprot:SAG11_NODE_2867_length_2890_cov_1.583662_2_plen_66_part_00
MRKSHPYRAPPPRPSARSDVGAFTTQWWQLNLVHRSGSESECMSSAVTTKVFALSDAQVVTQFPT